MSAKEKVVFWVKLGGSGHQKKRNKCFARVRQAVERVIGTLKCRYGLERCRYLGLRRNHNHLWVKGICYNLKELQEDAMNRDDVIGYIDLYSNEGFEEAVNSYFTKDAYFWNTRISLRGTQKIIDWPIASHLGYSEKLTPVTLIVEPEGAAIELEQEFYAKEDMSHFFIRPMKKGEVFRTRGVLGFWNSERAKSVLQRNIGCSIDAIRDYL